ncbi:MAG TPA: ATP-binding protein, partial [Roseiflexaceae bacterium]|nr:ATP-binding protein [Roseiflexaceae bacterium]
DRATLIGQMIEVLLPERFRHGHTRYRGSYFTAPHTRLMGSGLELVARRQDGSEFAVEISLSPLHTESGLLIISAIRDISERKRAEAELRRQSAFVQLLQVAAVTANEAISVEAAVQRVLEQVCTHLGWPLGHAFLLSSDATGELVPTVLWYLEDPQRFADFRQATQITRFAPGAGLVGQVLASGKPDWMADVSVDARFLRAQQARQAGLRAGFALPVLVGAEVVAVLEFFTTEAVERDASLLEVLANVGTQLGRVVERSRTAANLEEQQRTLAERLDTTEAGMLQAARLAAVGQLAASIAHEINNPLYAARNCLALLEQDTPPASRESPFLSIAREQLTRIAGIIERMREFYRPDRGTMTPCDIHHLLEETLALASLNIRNQSVRVIFTPAHTLPEVVGNGDQLRQVFLNLILNAIEAMPNGGTLTVRTIAGPNVAIVEVQDTGLGIPADIRARLFEPFFTNKPNGTGLGLSISAHIVTQHGGQIEVDSTERQGSIFRVVLPYQPGR